MSEGPETPSDQSGWATLAREVKARRHVLQLSHAGVARAGGPSHETVRLVEQYARPSFRSLTLMQLDRGLSWKPGTAWSLVEGTATDRSGWPAPMHATPTPAPSCPSPVLLGTAPDVEVAGELVSRITRGGIAPRDREVLAALLELVGRLSSLTTADDAGRSDDT